LIPSKPHDQAGYFDVSTDLAHSVRPPMVDALQSWGSMSRLRTTTSPLVKAKIDFAYGPALMTADSTITSARRQGDCPKEQSSSYLMPKPIAASNGSRCTFTRACGLRTKETVMLTPDNSTPDDTALHLLPQLAHAPAIQPISRHGQFL